MDIAVVGAGISGMVAARMLSQKHTVSLFEAGATLGGHTHTVDISYQGRDYAIDTGFIVFNKKTYPNFVRLLAEIGVAIKPTTMSFSVTCERSNLEYNGTSLNQLFAQRRNLLRPAFWRMIRDILRFNREVRQLLADDEGQSHLTLGEYLNRGGFSDFFIEKYILPMGAAIWSTGRTGMLAFPAVFFARFFENHGFLNVNDRPQWYVIEGGSRSYIEPMVACLGERIYCKTPIKNIVRDDAGVTLELNTGSYRRFDHVVLAVHADHALRLLAEPSALEREILGAMPYAANEPLLHTDGRILPKRPRAWAAWNYRITGGAIGNKVAVTYLMNHLQGVEASVPFCVTLNQTEQIDPKSILKRMVYHHPTFTVAGLAAQRRFAEINNQQRVSFCGAYWFNGFHEDGVRSGLRVAEELGCSWP